MIAVCAFGIECRSSNLTVLMGLGASVLAFDSSNDPQAKAYPLRTKIFTTVAQLERRYKAPRLALLHLINQEWRLSQAAMRDLSTDSNRNVKVLPVEIPSKCRSSRVSRGRLIEALKLPPNRVSHSKAHQRHLSSSNGSLERHCIKGDSRLIYGSPRQNVQRLSKLGCG